MNYLISINASLYFYYYSQIASNFITDFQDVDST